MKILSTTLLISFMTVFAVGANAGSDGSEARGAQQPKPRLATTKDLLDAGYRQGYAAALENTPAGSSSVTTPLSYRKPVYVEAPTTQPQPRFVNAPALETAPRKLPSYVQRLQPQVQPMMPKMQPKHHSVQRIQQSARHAGHGHHTQAQMIDCELTDSLNRNASPVTTILSTQKYHGSAASPVKQQYKPFTKPVRLRPVANYKHGDHYHHTSAERADCALTDALNRQAGPVSSPISRHSSHSPVKQHIQQNYSHGNHSHHSEAERADCALTDALNHGGSVVRVVRKY